MFMNKKSEQQRGRRKRESEEKFKKAQSLLEAKRPEWDFKEIIAKRQSTLKDDMLLVTAFHHWEFLRELQRRNISIELSNNFAEGLTWQKWNLINIAYPYYPQNYREYRGLSYRLRGIDFDLMEYSHLLGTPYGQLHKEMRKKFEEQASRRIQSKACSFTRINQTIPVSYFTTQVIGGGKFLVLDTKRLYETHKELKYKTFVIAIDWDFSNDQIIKKLKDNLKDIRPQGWKPLRRYESDIVRVIPFSYNVSKFILGMSYRRMQDELISKGMRISIPEIIRIYLGISEYEASSKANQRGYKKAKDEYDRVINAYRTMLSRREELRAVILASKTAPAT